MWNRKELKARAKAAFKANYWRCVLAAVILMLISGSLSYRGGRSSNSDVQVDEQQIRQGLSSLGLNDPDYQEGFVQGYQWTLNRRNTGKTAAALGGAGLASLVLSILVFNPLIVGCYRFFLQNSRGDGNLKHLGVGFQDGWGNVVLVMFLKNLFLVLWTLLFIIPGLVKIYSYRLVPYLLKEHPELKGTEAITLSRKMMKGHKWNAFVLDLSFLGWILLSILTLGILNIFYVWPYMSATDAELYEAISRNYDSQA